MTDRHDPLTRPQTDRASDRCKPVEAPREHQGVCDSLARCFAVESLPEDFRGLLSRLR